MYIEELVLLDVSWKVSKKVQNFSEICDFAYNVCVTYFLCF